MTPGARLQAVVEILQGLAASAQPADRFLHDWFRERRFAGSKDRAAITDLAFAVLRHRASFAWRMNSDDARALVIASLLAEGLSADAIAGLFDGEGYNPPALSDAERRAIASPPKGEPPLHARGEFPQFLEAELTRAFGPLLLEEMNAFQERAPVDLRVNTLKTSRQKLLAALLADGFAVKPTPYSPLGLRLPPGEGSARLGASPWFTEGAFEFQDESAQIAALLCCAKTEMRALDLAAGAGGKSLALAALMQNQGEIVAHDIRASVLSELERRATRAGATIILPSREVPSWMFDCVLIDAPCSGTGTWRRQPELRWRLTPERLKELTATQDRLLEAGAEKTALGGRLVYATCSVLPVENEDRIKRFLTRHAGFAALTASEVWSEAIGTPPPGMDRFFKASPYLTGTDGFFVAVLQRHSWTTPVPTD